MATRVYGYHVRPPNSTNTVHKMQIFISVEQGQETPLLFTNVGL